MSGACRAVLFDLLTALVDSWSLWDQVAGSATEGTRWRTRYLELAYGAGAYRPCENLIRQSATDCGLGPGPAAELITRWGELEPWAETPAVLQALRGRVALGVVTNCSLALGRMTLSGLGRFEAVVIAEEVGYYKPRPEPYRRGLELLGCTPDGALFVAGSPGDVAGAAAVGMKVYWHNRRSLSLPSGASPPTWNETTLSPLPEILLGRDYEAESGEKRTAESEKRPKSS